MQKLKLSTWVVGDKLENFDSFNDFSIHVASGTLVYKTIYGNWRSKLEIPKNREAEKLKKNRTEKKRWGRWSWSRWGDCDWSNGSGRRHGSDRRCGGEWLWQQKLMILALFFSSKFVWHKNFESVPDNVWGCSYFSLRVNK